MCSLVRALVLFMFICISACASADSLTTTGGKKLLGKLVAVDAQGVTLLTTEGTSVKVPAKEIHLVDLGHPIAPLPKETRYHEIELTDGSTFRITKFAIKGKNVVADLLPGPPGIALPTYQINLGSVFSIFRNADDYKARENWKKLLANRGKRDLYVIREAEGLNFVSGSILNGNEAGDSLTFEKEDGSKAELRLSRATGGLVFAQPPAMQVAPTLCKVLDVFGNVLVAQSVEISRSVVSITTVAGVVVKYPSVNAIAKLDYAQGNVAYLSDLDPQVDLPPIGMDEKGLRTNVVVPFFKDQGLANEPLKLGSEIFTKGISIAPDTKLVFNLGGEFREFKALVGLPESSPDAGLEARLTIETEEGRVLFSELLKRKEKPRSVAVDIKGVKLLRVLVEGDFLVNGNRIILADARVQK